MVQDNSAFALDTASDTNGADTQRRRKLTSLQSLFRAPTGDGQDTAALQEQPLNDGRLSKDAMAEGEAAGAGEPSLLATERVQRAPVSMQESSPLLGGAERLGNALDEAVRGEEGSAGYGPMSGAQRGHSLRDFFGNASSSSASASSPTSNDVGGADQFSTDLGYAKQGLGAANTADKATGGNADAWLKSLFKSSAPKFSTPNEGATPEFPGEALGVPSVPTEAPTYPGESLGVPSNSYNAGAAAAGSALGTGASAIGLLSLLYSLYQQRGGDASPGQFVGLINSSGGLSSGLGSLLGGTVGGAGAAGGAATAGAALGGIGATMGVGMNLGNMVNDFMTGDDRTLGAGIGTGAAMGVGAGVGAVAGTVLFPGIGTVVGALLGMAVGGAAGGALGGLFGQNLPHYYSIRAHAGDVAQGAARQYYNGVIAAGNTGDINQVQKALGQSFADGHVRVDLNLPLDVARAIGIKPNAPIASLTPDQFGGLVKAYIEREGYNSDWFVGSGDVGYLSGAKPGGNEVTADNGRQGPAQAIATGVANIARGTFDSMVQAAGQNLDRLPPVAPLHMEHIGDYNIAPELQYQAYNTHTGERGAGAPTWDPTDYASIKAAAQGGTLSDLFMGGGKALGTPAQRAAAQAKADEFYRRQQYPWEFDPNYFQNLPTQGG